VEGSGAVHHATRDSRVGTVPSHYSKGYPCSRVLIVALGPASGEEMSLQVGAKLDWHTASMLLISQLLLVRLRSRQLSRLSPRLTDLWPPHLMVLSGHARGASIPLHWLLKFTFFVFCCGLEETWY
jgi:hypothetical protein